MTEEELLQLIKQAKKEKWEEFALDCEKIPALPPQIGRLTDLKVLRLRNCSMTTLPGEVGQLRNLNWLDLSGNQLTQLPREIGQLINLNTLELSGNQLTQLPTEIGQLRNLNWLILHHNRLTQLPREIGQLINLNTLELDDNKLTQLPREITQLRNLNTLELDDNKLTQLPREITQLRNLNTLELDDNKLTQLPREITQLRNLKKLYLSNNQLTQLPREIGQLRNLKKLYLSNNQLTQLPREITQLRNLIELDLSDSQLTQLPREITQLRNLNWLNLSYNQLTQLPREIAQLINLIGLYLGGNQLTQLPGEIGQLEKLEVLGLEGNPLTQLPTEIAQLRNLKKLDLENNQLTQLPTEIGQLEKLEVLDLEGNPLTQLPTEIAQLRNLNRLDLQNNQLTQLPKEIGQLEKLEVLDLEGNPLTFPPPEIVEMGTQEIRAYLREQAEASEEQWVSKMILVGEGGVGKTQLLRRLRGEDFDPNIDTTHGIDIRELKLDHPERDDITMTLNCWDFGGQEIYHATHQFFLTQRSLFLLLWNARLGFEQGKLYYWLDTIKAKAPDTPVIIVATHIDQRDADLPLKDLKARYPQIVDQWEVSNTENIGFEELKEIVRRQAAGLPLMGESWPKKWVEAAEAVKGLEKLHCPTWELFELFKDQGVEGDDARILAEYLHDLGLLLYYPDDPELKDIIILKPQWVTEHISWVLESDEVIEGLGILRDDHLQNLWADLEPHLHEPFLRLMEKFDLSYRTQDPNREEISIVVERLSHDQPKEIEEIWQGIETAPFREISMKFDLHTTRPAGIPTWFIARSHRFTTHNHYRYGALFGDCAVCKNDFNCVDCRECKHMGLITAPPNAQYLTLRARGELPHNFFTLLRDGLEVTLERFPGIKITRTVPCPGHDGNSCPHEFDLAHLEKAAIRGKREIQCPVTLEMVSVPELLFGIHWSTNEDVIRRIDELEITLTQKLEIIRLAQRLFIDEFHDIQRYGNTHCPNIFSLRTDEPGGLWKAKKMTLQLYCQAPGCWHPTVEGGCYPIREPAKFMQGSAWFLRRLIPLMKIAVPVAGAFAEFANPALEAATKADIKLITTLVDKLPGIDEDKLGKHLERLGEDKLAREITGKDLRYLREVLDEADPEQVWGGLKKTLTPEGHYLWLCDYHREPYLR